MFAETYTLSKDDMKSPLCTVQVGLSSGIPYIKYFGDISSRYIRSREKIPFIFSYLGRKLPQKKLRVNFSSQNYISDGTQIDLAVITGIYLATNDVGLDEEAYCFGEVDMNGIVRSVSGLEKFLWNLRELKNKHVIFIPNDLDHLRSIYRSLNIIPVKSVQSVFHYFEGTYDDKVKNVIKFRNSKWEEMAELSIVLTLLEEKSILVLGSEIAISAETFSKLITILSSNRSLTYQINSILSLGMDQYLSKKFILIDSIEKLHLFDSLSIQEDQKIFLLINKLDLSKINDEDLILLVKILEKFSTIINAPPCGCGYHCEKCICTTRQLARYRDCLYRVASICSLIRCMEYPLENEQRIGIDQDTEIKTINDIENIGYPSNSKISSLKNEIVAKRNEFLEDI